MAGPWLQVVRRWLFAMLAFACLIPLTARAADYSAGTTLNGSVATIWFKSNVGSTWVDAHYNVNGGAQQNVRMNWNSSTSQFETTFTASAGQTVNYQFTYNIGSAAYDSPWGSSVLASGNQAATPTFSPAGGSYSAAQSVSISTSTPGATLYYTTDGSTPTTSSPQYTVPFTVSASETVKAIATASGMTASQVGSATYTIGSNNGGGNGYTQGVAVAGTTATIWFAPTSTIQWVDVHYDAGAGLQNVRMAWNASNARYEQPVTVSAGTTINYSFTWYTTFATDTPSYSYTVSTSTVATPAISPNGGSFSSAQSVTLTDATPGAAIHYTVDGSTPTASSPTYTGPITVSSSTTVKAIGTASGMTTSGVASAAFTISGGTVATPVITPNGGSFTSAQSVTITDGTTGATIHYTVDGSTPTASSPTYTGPLTVSRSATVKAIGTKSGMSNSAVASAAFTITGTVATPTFSPAPGSFGSTQSVTISDATPGAAIHYTLDGSTPTASSPTYTGPLSIATTTTVKAIGTLTGWTNSAVASGTWTISNGSSYVQGVTELGATATVWFKPSGAMNWVILHEQVGTGTQNNPQMAWNSSLSRYEFVISNLSAGNVIHYSFTYSPVGGAQQDTPAYTYTMGQDNGIPVPTYSPVGGTYQAAQTVTLSTTASNATIHYTTDGSAPNALSPVYSAPIPVARSTSFNAITVLADGEQSRNATSVYVIGDGSGPVAAPTFSLPTGTYGTHLRITMASTTPGATLHYTIDGSTPTATSPIYGVPLEVSATTTVKAIAVRAGVSSTASAATYTLTGNGSSTWNGMTTFRIANATNGKWPDDQVYWAIIGKDWNTNQFVHVDASGHLIPMSLADNGALMKNGLPYSNYFHKLSDLKQVTIPPINSARIMFSVGSPMYIWINQDVNGNIAYAGANIENPQDPNIDVTFDFGEFAILPPGSNPQGIFVNTTRVDQFGFPVKLDVTGLDGFSASVGEPLTESRDELFARFVGTLPTQFGALAQAPYAPWRIVAPAHATFMDNAPNGTYLDAYITQVWNQYTTQDLVIDLKNGWPPFTGRVSGNVFHFTDSTGGSYFINGKPTTSMVLLGDGLLNDPTGASDVGKQLQLQAQMCAALNRQVAQRAFADWWNSTYFYPASQPANWFAKFWHDHSIDALSYGFAYDDVGNYSPSVHTEAPVSVTFTIGW